MGLEGTLHAFSATDILGLLGSQRKTGVLTIESPQDAVTISFLGGQIVMAESAARSLDDRLAALLGKSGKLAPDRLRAALAEQKETREPLAVLLLRKRAVSPDDLAQALRLQICRISLAAFRWGEGEFKFREDRAVDHDTSLIDPIPTDVVLKESARGRQEWPKLEERVPSPDTVYRRAPGFERLRLVHSRGEVGAGALLVSRAEAEIWPCVDGKRRVRDILDQVFLSDLDVYGGLSELLDRSLIAPAPIDAASGAQPRPGTSRRGARPLGGRRNAC